MDESQPIERAVTRIECDAVVRARRNNERALDGQVIFLGDYSEYADGSISMYAKLRHDDGREVWYHLTTPRDSML